MRIENVVALTRGELITAPSISHFEDTMVSTSLVKRGDLFIALNPEEIVKAIYAGAYGIIYDDDTITPMDPEIAFIKVRNTKSAAYSIARYCMIKKNFRFICVDHVTFEIIKKISKTKEVDFIEQSGIKGIFSLLKNDDATIVFGYEEDFLTELTTDTVETFLEPRECSMQTSGTTLFESTITIDSQNMRVKLPQFQLKYLENAIHILKEFGLEYDLTSVGFIKFFDPVFVDEMLNQKEFGKTSKVIIFTEYYDKKLLKETMSYFCDNTKWAKNLYVFPISHADYDDGSVIITLYGSERELKDILEENDFNFAFVVNGDKSKLIKEKKESSIFTFSF